MSLKLLKPQEKPLACAELESSFFRGELYQIQQRKWRNTWSFRLERRIPLDAGSWNNQAKKKWKMLVRKFYGKRVSYILKSQETKRFSSHSKIFNFVKLDTCYLTNNSLKSKGNFIIFANPQSIKGLHDPLILKKTIKNCEKAEIFIKEGQDQRLAKYLLAVKKLDIILNKNLGLASLGGILRNLLGLQKLKVETTSEQNKISDKSKIGFFASLNKLLHLKRVKLILESKDIEKNELKQDLERFYDQPHNFNLSITIEIIGKLDNKLQPVLMKILSAAKYLALSDRQEDRLAYNYRDSKKKMIKEEKRIKKSKKNCVEIVSFHGLDVLQFLANCDSLEHLYLRAVYFDRITWKKSSCHSQEEEIKALQNVKSITLEFSEFIAWNYQEDDTFMEMIGHQRRNYCLFSSPLLTIFSQIKGKCLSLQSLSLYLCLTDRRRNLEWIQKYCPTQLLSYFETVKRIGQEFSTFDKLKALGILIVPQDLRRFSVGEILSNKSLESFQLIFNENTEDYSPDWENSFSLLENNTKLKKLAITFLKQRMTPLFRTNLLYCIQTFENLEVAELIDKNLEIVTFDFLCGFVTSLLEKKTMRKILICTKAINTVASINSGRSFSKIVGASFWNMLIQIRQEFEGLVRNLKDLQLEEIFVGKLEDYGFDYLLYNKEVGITEKLFWTEKEMKELLSQKQELAWRYKDEFKLFKIRE